MNKAQKYAVAIKKQQEVDPLSPIMKAVYHKFAMAKCFEVKWYSDDKTGCKDNSCFFVNKTDGSVLFLRLTWNLHVINGVDYYVGRETVRCNSANGRL